jgi:hypothetical protein
VRVLPAGALGLLLATSALAQEAPPDPEVVRLRQSFEYGKYGEVLSLGQARIDRGGLGEAGLLELHRLVGLAAFNLGKKDEAERHLAALLRLDPDHALDPFVVPPPAVQFFEGLRKKLSPELSKIRELKAMQAMQAKQEAEARRRTEEALEAQRQRLESLSRRVTVRTVQRRSTLLNFVPFGAGQFQQGRNTHGLLLATSEGALAATSIIAYWALEALFEVRQVPLPNRVGPSETFFVEERGIPVERRTEAEVWQVIKYASAAAFYAVYAYGVYDALRHHQDEVVTETTLERPAPSRTTPSGATSSPPALEPYLFPSHGGASAGVAIRF